jgi:hypothetical protein
VKRFLAACGASEDRAVVNGAEQVDVRVDLGGLVEAPGAQFDMFESLAIGAEGAASSKSKTLRA